MRSVIIVFAKMPVPGRVKTRLIPRLGPDLAAAFHAALTGDLIESLQTLSGVDLELHTDIPGDAWNELKVARRGQREGALPLKLLHGLREALAGGRSKALIVGSDAPGLPLDHLRELLVSPSDVTFGPAADGGFWGIACSRVEDRMFDGVRWSSPWTLADARAAAARSGLSVAIGSEWWDADEPHDLDRLFERPEQLGPRVRSCIEAPEWRASFAGIDRENRPARRGSP